MIADRGERIKGASVQVRLFIFLRFVASLSSVKTEAAENLTPVQV